MIQQKPCRVPLPTIQSGLSVSSFMHQKFKMSRIKTGLYGTQTEINGSYGIDAGEVVLGNMGSETRAKYGIVGSPLDHTQRQLQAES